MHFALFFSRFWHSGHFQDLISCTKALFLWLLFWLLSDFDQPLSDCIWFLSGFVQHLSGLVLHLWCFLASLWFLSGFRHYHLVIFYGFSCHCLVVYPCDGWN